MEDKEDFSNRKCETCSLGQEGFCELALEAIISDKLSPQSIVNPLPYSETISNVILDISTIEVSTTNFNG